MSFNTFNLRLARQFRVWNDRLTRGGALTRQPAGYSGRVGVETDRRKPWQVSAAFDFQEDSADGWSRRGEVGLGVRFLEIVEVQAGPSVTRTRAAAQYVTTVSDPAAVPTFGERYVFAPLEQTTVAVETRLNVTFTPNLTFELYAQPFVSGGEYGDLMELQSPRTFDFRIYGRDVGSVRRESDGRHTVHPDGTGNRSFQIDPLDFNFRALLGNAVLRWEWRPGSTLFLVWQQTRSEELLDTASPEAAGQVGSFRLGPDTRALFGLRPDNLFMLKVTYWLNP